MLIFLSGNQPLVMQRKAFGRPCWGFTIIDYLGDVYRERIWFTVLVSLHADEHTPLKKKSFGIIRKGREYGLLSNLIIKNMHALCVQNTLFIQSYKQGVRK